MAIIAVQPKDPAAYEDLKRHILAIVEDCGSCEMTREAFISGAALKNVEMGFAEMQAHIRATLNGEPRRVLPEGPRNEEEFIQQMAKEMGCEVTRPTTRPWNVLFRKALQSSDCR